MVNSAYMNILVTNAEHDTETPDLGLGTTIATGVQSVLSAVAGWENILTGYTNTIGTKSASIGGGNAGGGLGGLQIGAGNPHLVHINLAATWANTAGAALDADLAGAVILNWSFFGLE